MPVSSNVKFKKFLESFEELTYKDHKCYDTITEISRKESGRREPLIHCHKKMYSLDDIKDNDLFEKFDFTIPETSIFVDFKNWHETTYKDSDKELLHIAKKAKECGCKCVIIANILGSENSKIRERTIDDVKIVVIPALLFNYDAPMPINSAWDKIRECIREYSN